MIELPLFLCIKEQNMKILILEDNLSRQEFFKVNLEKHNLTITDSSKVTIEKLSTEKWDILFLDHDLGGQVHVESGENTGYEVAKFLEQNKKFMPLNIIVHSLNVVGAKNIINALPNAFHIPFAWDKKNSDLIVKICSSN